MSAPRVAVVVVTYNSADELPRCLESLRDGGADGVELTDVMVVDNASDDDVHRDRQGVRRAADLGRPADRERRLRRGAQRRRRRRSAAGHRRPSWCSTRTAASGAARSRMLAEALQAPGRGHRRAAAAQPGRDAAADPAPAPTIPGVFAESILGGRIANRFGLGELVFSEGPHERPGPVPWAGCRAPDVLAAAGAASGPGTRATSSTARRPSTCCGRPTTAGRRGTSRRRSSSTRAASPAPAQPGRTADGQPGQAFRRSARRDQRGACTPPGWSSAWRCARPWVSGPRVRRSPRCCSRRAGSRRSRSCADPRADGDRRSAGEPELRRRGSWRR